MNVPVIQNTFGVVGAGGLRISTAGGQTVVHGAPIDPVINQPVFTYVG